MIFVHLAHALSLNDVCDWLRLKARAIAAFVQTLFWRTLDHLQRAEPGFGTRHPGGWGKRLLHRFKVRIHAVDSSVIELVANCRDWAKHRRRKRVP